MSADFFTDVLLTLAVPAAFVGGAWALAVYALNLSDQQTQWLHHLFSPNRENPASRADQSSSGKSKNSFVNPKDL